MHANFNLNFNFNLTLTSTFASLVAKLYILYKALL